MSETVKTVTLRKSKDGSLFFIQGGNRAFWLAAEKNPLPPDPAHAKAHPYSGLFLYSDYCRRWFSMRGFIVKQGAPEMTTENDPRVVDYRAKTLADSLTLE